MACLPSLVVVVNPLGSRAMRFGDGMAAPRTYWRRQ